MRYYSVDEVEQFCLALWSEEAQDDDFKLIVRAVGDGYTIEISRMYSYVPLNLARLISLADFFDTKNISDSWVEQRGGCESCDYGSNYEVTLSIYPEEE